MAKEITELYQTVGFMSSGDYKQRFKAEYYQLKIRYDALKTMVEKWDKAELDFEPVCPRDTYTWQLKIMEEYLQILKMRANMEHIDL